MPTQKKIDTVADLKERISRATLVASADYRGLRVKEMAKCGGASARRASR